jgi:hypothetical protein
MKSLREPSGPYVRFNAFQSGHAVLRFLNSPSASDEIVAGFLFELKHGSIERGFCVQAAGASRFS